jgi:succinate-semialdehyde dehydrogenase / glutarate-semialdehyde dehydrogenase
MTETIAAAPELARGDLLRTQAWIDGAWIDSDSGESIAVTNPATGEELAQIPNMGPAETRRAIEAAERALPAWRAKPAKERALVLRRWADLMREHVEDLALLLTLEQGKPLAESRTEIDYAASFFEWFGEEGKRVYGDTIPAPNADRRVVVLKQPIGVTVGITPWNFPAAMVTRKAAPALAAGCTMVMKPASQTPLSALAVTALGEEAGIPAGVYSIVTGDAAPIGAEMTSNALVRKLGFTGSTAIGKMLMAECAKTLKKVSLELGGNAPFIVFDDADLDEAVAGAILCKFRNSGQTCISANRIFVQDGIYDAFLERLVETAAGLKVGPGTLPDVKIGPLIEDRAVEKVEQHVADALDRGGELHLGGHRHELGHTFFQPTVITGVVPEATMSCDETFGPVAGIARFSTDDEAVQAANATQYGLASYFYSRDLGRVWRVAEGLEYGMVGINTGFISTEVAPFGGVKESGIGREGSKYGIDEWLELKYLAVGGI